MKTKHGNLVVTILITVVVVLLAGLMIAWQTGLFKGQKQQLNSGTEKINNEFSSIADFDLLVYDGNTIKGETLMDLIADFKARDVKVSLWVNTLDTTNSYYNYAYTASNLGAVVTITPPPSKATSGYITESANFLGDVIRNTNNEIVCLKFTQQK